VPAQVAAEEAFDVTRGRASNMDVIIADAAPLRRLALANILNVLPQVGGRVRMADMTAFEAAQQVDEPGARHLRDWLAAGQVAGSSRVSVEETSAGQLFILARQVDPALCARRSGRTAAIDWLAEAVQGAKAEVMVICGDSWMARIVANQGNGAAMVVTLDGFLQLAR